MSHLPTHTSRLNALISAGAFFVAAFGFLLQAMFPQMPADSYQAFIPGIPVAQAGTTQTLSSALPPENVNDSSFSLVVCDGPHNPAGDADIPVYDAQGNKTGTRPYRVCDFNAAMVQVQHLINIAIIAGVLLSIVAFCYIGYLYITGTEKNISRAKEIFPKIFIGFIIMVTAWFIVYQILSWLAQPSATALLGK